MAVDNNGINVHNNFKSDFNLRTRGITRFEGTLALHSVKRFEN